MSKAFTREDDDLPDRPSQRRPPSALPPGMKNYLTADGARRFQEELDRLVQTERPKLATLPECEKTKHQLQAMDQRMLHLQQCLQSAVVVPPPVDSDNQVRFGATVTVRERNDEKSQYRIVGVDEADFDRGWISFLSPVAKALMNARTGQRVRLKLPAGEQELEIVGITYH
jgi:transcription elongation factor GreB